MWFHLIESCVVRTCRRDTKVGGEEDFPSMRKNYIFSSIFSPFTRKTRKLSRKSGKKRRDKSSTEPKKMIKFSLFIVLYNKKIFFFSAHSPTPRSGGKKFPLPRVESEEVDNVKWKSSYLSRALSIGDLDFQIFINDSYFFAQANFLSSLFSWRWRKLKFHFLARFSTRRDVLSEFSISFDHLSVSSVDRTQHTWKKKKLNLIYQDFTLTMCRITHGLFVLACARHYKFSVKASSSLVRSMQFHCRLVAGVFH